jgi:hypothetical protein
LLVALLTVATVTHHLLPEHSAAMGAGEMQTPAGATHHAAPMGSDHASSHAAATIGLPHHGEAPAPRPDHAMPVMVACLGIVGGGFVLAYVGAVVRVRRPRRPRAAPSRSIRRAGPLPGRAACRDGPPIFLRLQVLRA